MALTHKKAFVIPLLMVLVTLASHQATSPTMDVDFIDQKHERIAQHGLTYLDSEQDGICDQRTATAAQITGFQDVTRNDEQALKNAVSRQPISVIIAAGGDFQNYGGGIFKGYCGDSLNHAVTIVGYGNENGGLLVNQEFMGPNLG
ncbi:hypothetical protein Dsin_020988 [Dipteronia sinensis]|uniref:Peptidase C1A papain C-terminal domain-containing protein n=1 Tax=Dipteronia sinensis TaxID=43782 RepID=A0AAE0AAA9_9ROSI|nr:hypothetical protein Dsin_020988 [Dipteronia sinensis]